MQVPFLELLPTYLELKETIDHSVMNALSSGWYIGGKSVSNFEEKFASYNEVAHCVSVGNGLDALQIALTSHGIGKGDKVLVPSHTFIATWLAVSAVGAIPVPVEPLPGRRIVGQEVFMDLLYDDIKAVMPVLLYGETADFSNLIEKCQNYKTVVIIDAAQAHGARISENEKLNRCTHCWSFYPGKNLGAFGDAGAITTNDAEVATVARKIANYGSEHKYVHELVGGNSRLDPLQAVILTEKLQCLDTWNRRRQAIAYRYSTELTGVNVPAIPHYPLSHVWHLFVVETPQRANLLRYLAAKEIGTQIHYPIPIHRQRAYSQYEGCALPEAERLAGTVLSLPMGPHLSMEQVDYVINSINDFK